MNVGTAKQVAPLGGGGKSAFQTIELANYGEFDLATSASQQQAALVAHQNTANAKHEFRIITSNSHIQILENGSMIIKDVELGDGARYACQATNGVNPSLSEVIDLQVLSKCFCCKGAPSLCALAPKTLHPHNPVHASL